MLKLAIDCMVTDVDYMPLPEVEWEDLRNEYRSKDYVSQERQAQESAESKGYTGRERDIPVNLSILPRL